MEFVFYAVAFIIAVLLIANFVQLTIYPPLEVAVQQLPAVVQHEMQTYFPSFLPSQIKLMRPRQRYLMKGVIDKAPCRLVMDLTPDLELVKVEFSNDSVPGRMTNKRPIAATEIPLRLAQVLEPFLSSTTVSSSSQRASQGLIDAERAYQIQLQTDEFEYEFEITESGRLVGFEKEQPHA